VIHVLFVFAVLNPLVMPFGLIYFTVEKSANLHATLVNALPILHFYSSRHQEPIFTRICKELRRERSEDFDPDHSILSGWYEFLY